MSKLTYSVVVRNPNSWNRPRASTKKLANCGHHHKTIVTAQACKDRLTAWHCLCGHTTQQLCAVLPHTAKFHFRPLV